MSTDRLIDAQLKDQALRHGLVGFEPTRDAFLGDEHEAERRAEAERARDEIAMIAGLRSSSPTKEFDIGAVARAEADEQRPLDLDAYESAGALEAVGADALKAALAERGMKAGGTLAERAARLFEAKGVSDLSTLPRALVAKRKASATAPADNGSRQPRGPLGPGQTMRPGATRLPTHKRPSNPRAPRKQPRYDMTAHKFAVDRGGADVLVDAPGAASNRERAIMSYAREIREPDG